jgi:hypothetical protein
MKATAMSVCQFAWPTRVVDLEQDLDDHRGGH